jgi:Right handed beta helix region
MLWCLASQALAASVTVNPGDDLNALTSSLLPGDVVTFNAGTYPLEGTVYWSGVGTESAPIVFEPAGNGEVILQNDGSGWVVQVNDSAFLEVRGLTLQGGKGYGYNSGLYVSNSTDLLLTNLTVKNVGGDALRLDGDTRRLTVTRNELSSVNSRGMSIGCGDASCWMAESIVEFNLVHDTGTTGMYLLPGTQDNVFQHNVLFNIGGTAIEHYSPGLGAQNLIAGNALWNVEGDGIYLEGGALVQNNVIFDIGDDGIQTRAPYGGQLSDLQISHNTIAQTEDWGADLGSAWYNGGGVMVFSNNAISNPTGRGMFWDDLRESGYYEGGYDPNYPDTAAYVTNNVVTGFVDGFDLVQRPTFVIPGGGVGDFEDPDNFDFYPTFSSQVRNAGDPNGNAYIPDRDFNGTARDGASPDAGAYEFDGEGNPGWTLQEGFKQYAESEGRSTSLGGGCCKGDADPATAAVAFPLALLALRRRSARAVHAQPRLR